jgi:nuclear pore complex protein Nup155
VITTPDEVILCALVRASEDGVGLRLVPTSFTLPTDNVRMLSVVGNAAGRVFMGGDDGCLYEMTYQGLIENSNLVSVEDRLARFYDEGVQLPNVLTADDSTSLAEELLSLGKRTWNSLSSSASEQDDFRPRKCRKLNRTSSSWMSVLLPDIILKAGSLLFGKTSTGGAKIVRLLVDEDRECLYTLGSDGWICSFDLSDESSIKLCAVMKTPTTARLYLEAVSRGQMLPPHSSPIRFPGGGSAAQAGVGGMEGARAILKAADLRNDRSGHGDVLKPISIHLVPPTESSRLTLMAVTTGGLRLYLSSLSSNVLSSGPAASSARNGNGNPLAPSPRLTLCHIRSPPPPSDELPELPTRMAGSIKPRVKGVVRVDASFYKQGLYVAATEKNSAGDMIVAVCPDSVARETESLEVITNPRQEKKTLVVPTGVAETISTPMTSAYGDSANNADAVLPGGIVWDIAPVTDQETPVMKLTTSSQTPTDSELDIGLPPAYFPPAKIQALSKSPTRLANGDHSSAGGTAVVSRNSDLATSALKVLGNVLTNALLSRPIRQGISFQEPTDDAGLVAEVGLRANYRLSQRHGSEGFSTTAGESLDRRSTSETSRPSKSARLRPWLLRPAAVPLNQISTQHVEQSREVVALNAGGLHYFGFNSTLGNLADSLLAAGENVANDPTITDIFKSYSYKEGCAMCLALAIGCGPTSGSAGFSDTVRSRATAAALARAYIPRLVAHDQVPGASNRVVSSTLTPSDPLLPSGYDFNPSALSEGLTCLFSRLVRPIWNKPAVVVTEGRTIKQPWSTKTWPTPAKVEVLLDKKTLEDIRAPMQNLLGLMKKVFSRALQSVPGMPERHDYSMEIDGENGEGQYLTKSLQYQNHLLAASGRVANHLNPAEAENLARLIEEKNIHSLYRLLARVVQLLNLMSLLQRVQDMNELNEIDWGLLHGLTIRQLVQTSDGQDRLESLLNELVTASASERAGLTPSAQADKLADLFAEQCYLFFSPGSRSAYLGLRLAGDALQQAYSSPRRLSLAKQAADHLRSAAKHWHSAPLVTGRILHAKEQDTSDQIALRAMQYGSPLAKAVDALMQLEDVASVVEVCLLTASNFKGGRSVGQDSPVNFVTRDGSSPYAFPWEQQLYHKRREQEPPNTASSRGQASSPSQVVPYGGSVNAKDAVVTCYALIFHHLSSLLNSRSSLGDNMVSACAASGEEDFLHAFFLHLLESNHADTLLRIDSPALVAWLRNRKEPDLSWRYYNVQGQHFSAGQVSWERANDANLPLSLEERIEYLARAFNSFTAAMEAGPQTDYSSFGSTEDIAQKAKEVGDTLNIARLQSRILRAVDSLKSDSMTDLTKESLQRLSTSLVPVSELYNDIAAAFGLFEYCLLILHACRHDDLHQIRNLWKNVICEEVLPCATRNETVYNHLQGFVGDIGLGSEVKFLSAAEAANSVPVFESGDWTKLVEARVVSVGKELYGTGGDYVFPVDYLLSLLEGTYRVFVSSLFVV